MISKELDTVWITSDGRKFLYEKEAETHEQKTNKEKLTWLEKLHLK